MRSATATIPATPRLLMEPLTAPEVDIRCEAEIDKLQRQWSSSVAHSKREVVEVYCDGGVWQGVMSDAVTARSSDYVGRTAVVIPDLDYGVVECFHDSLSLPNGHEDGFHAEMVAIRHADDASKRKHLQDRFVIYSDNVEAVKEINLPHVRLIPRDGRVHFADEYLYKMRSRAGYVRRSTGKVKNRRPISPINDEIKRLMTTERIEFRLSESPLFQKFKSEEYTKPR